MKTLLTLIFLFLSLGLVVAQTAVQSTSFEKKTFQMFGMCKLFSKDDVEVAKPREKKEKESA